MSDLHDERLALPIEQGVLLWCVRAWVLEMRRPSGGAEERINDLLDRFGTPGAAASVKGFVFALGHAAARTINVQCTCCTRIVEDEHAILDVLGLAQAGQPVEALLVLRGLANAEGARAVLRSAEGIGAAFAQAGRFLPAPDAEVRRYAIASSSTAPGRPAHATLH